MLNYNKIKSDIDSRNTVKTKLSSSVGIPNSTLRDRLEKKNLTPDNVEKLADYFGRTIAYYFDREENEAVSYTNAEKKGERPEEVEGPCPSCTKLLKDIIKLQENLIEAKNETLSIMRGETKKEKLPKVS